MSNKQRAVIVIYSSGQDLLKDCGIEETNKLIDNGNSTLLVLRKAQEEGCDKEVELFKRITGLSWLAPESGAGDSESIIERNFFKKHVKTFNEMFHNGGFKNVQVISNNEEVLKYAASFSMNPSSDFTLSTLPTHELSIFHITNDASLFQATLASLHTASSKEQLLQYLALYPLPITEGLLKPKVENTLLQGLTPPQTYLTIGSQTLTEVDINQNQGVLLIECDKEYMRIDHFKELKEIFESVGQGKNEFLYKYQLAESFMKQVAFKMGKMEKFGA
ncbi:hypothetical protein FGO68_gene10961 [Halteria grandinella]|uniref:Uncharacterized protein n=1 Tax=Halteria grandinella TaxID=5974 RepID=A0A8J8NSY7_HALGN|nr:hypothetical protein FGO68_gene10961 [Halteria grandinella]